MRDRDLVFGWSVVLGALLIVFGILGFVNNPLVGAAPNNPVAVTGTIHDMVHLATGAIALYIAFEAPLSGMSLNPARSVASALPSGIWHGIWIYLTAPALGMLLAAELHVRRGRRTPCAKLHHNTTGNCIFRCDYAAAQETDHVA